MSQKLTVGIFIFDNVEVLDFAGPFEVFSRTRLTPGLDSRRSDDTAPFTVFTVAERAAMIEATGGLHILPHYGFSDAPAIDLSPLVRESMMLSLPTRPLCGEECRGLCAPCGANRNTTECACRDDWSDPRLDVLRTLKR